MKNGKMSSRIKTVQKRKERDQGGVKVKLGSQESGRKRPCFDSCNIKYFLKTTIKKRRNITQKLKVKSRRGRRKEAAINDKSI